jgi:hypothetical protein
VAPTQPLPIADGDKRTFSAKKGVINIQGTLRFSLFATTRQTFAIVGGTGKFKEAHGTVTVREVGPNLLELTYRVS